ncbi:probable ATP-dependent RNA helicase ddx20 [Chrysoperla carnea]|uniref:probable ATP-dependent RNA helicase ddx20 n=1 Tax=Chrysoperla carnea TaxID=189513 RepID=UPI001D0667A2|nr:probable ATP-dependent RNA helicase ddx20 [Chrysoperla carnea]
MFKSLAHNIDDKQRTNDVYISENVDFAGMLLSPDILNGLNAAGFKKPSPIQLKAIPLAMCGFDLIVQSKSGTGKTAVFSIVALQSISTQIKDPQVLILTPTREIAVQIQHVLNTIGSELKDFNAEYFIGGLPVAEDKQKLVNKNIHVAIGAPGRIKSLIENKHLKTKNIKLFILDEADKLMYESFKDDIDFINKSLPKSKQIIATSATYTDELHNSVAQYMKSPTKISVETDIPTLLGLKQFVSLVTHHLNIVRQIQYKTNELTRILSTVPFKQCIVFTNYQIRAESLSNDLNKTGWPSTFIAASQTQEQRLKALKKLKNHECRLLISTDLTARGIDAENVNLVINYDVPYDGATYLHRIGRAGRYGSLGLCITICCNGDEYTKFKNLIGTISTDIELLKLPTNESMPSNLWKCDNMTFEKVSFNQSLKENTFENNDGCSNTYEIQSDNLLKISDLQLEADMNSLVENHLNSTYNPQDKINMESTKKDNNKSVINEEKTSDFGTPMLQDLSSTPHAMKIQKEKLLIQEKNSVDKLNDSKSTDLHNFDENKDVKTNEDVNENSSDYQKQKVFKTTMTNGFKSFDELKSSFASHQNINVVQNGNVIDKDDSGLTNLVNFDNPQEKTVHLDVNRNGNSSPEKSDIGKTTNKKFKSSFKSFAELKTSIASHQHINGTQTGDRMDKVETKGYKAHEKLTNGSSFSNLESFDGSNETSHVDVNRNDNYPSRVSELENTRSKTLENGFKSFAELKTSLVGRQNVNEKQIGIILDNGEPSGFKSFEELKNIRNDQNNCNKTQETLPEPLNLIENFVDKSKQYTTMNGELKTTNGDENQSIVESTYTNIDKVNVSELQEAAINVEKNLTKKSDFVRIIESKVVIDSNSTKKTYDETSDRCKSIDNYSQRVNEEISPCFENSQPKNHSKSKTSKFHCDPTQKSDDEFYYSQNYNPNINYSNTKYDFSNVSRFSACPTCRCTCNTVRDNTNYVNQPDYYQLQEQNYRQSNINTSFYSGNNYINSWYNMWREQVLHVRNHVQQTIYMREMKKYNQ